MLNDIISSIKAFLCKLHGLTDDHNYVPIMHIFSKEFRPRVSDQEAMNLVWSLLEELQGTLECSNLYPQKIKQWMEYIKPTCSKGTQTYNGTIMDDHTLVQITCSKKELDRRIDAFIKRKRTEADVFNQREFTKFHDGIHQFSCARTDAIYVQRQSKKSLVKIKRVDNNYKNERKPVKYEKTKHLTPFHPSTTLPFYALPSDIQERTNNLTPFLNPAKQCSKFSDIYKHLQSMEERLLYLETLSPEYFHHTNNCARYNQCEEITSPAIRSPVQQIDIKGSNNLELIDHRIHELQEKLRKKAKVAKEE